MPQIESLARVGASRVNSLKIALRTASALVAAVLASPAVLTSVAGLAAAFAGAATQGSDLEVLQRWPVGGDGGWDYLTLDESGARLFVSRATRVDVIDTASGRVIGTVQGTPGVHGIAIAADLGRGYSSNGQGDSVTAFDLRTLAVIATAPVSGHNPDAIVYDAAGKHVFTFNGKSKDVSVLDASSLAVITTLAVPDKPEFAVDDAAGRIFANIESEAGQLAVIDTHKLAVTAIWPLPGCSSPSGLAIDREHHRLFSVCDNKVMAVTDAASGRQVARVPIGDGPDAAAYDPARRLVFSSNGAGTLTVVRQNSADRYEVEGNVPTQPGARTLALDPVSGKIYLVSARFGAAPAATPEHPHPRPAPISGSFSVLVVAARAAPGAHR